MIANRKNVRSSNNSKATNVLSIGEGKQRKNEAGDLLPRFFTYLVHPSAMHKTAEEKKRRETE
jgi:hypothetical protein